MSRRPILNAAAGALISLTAAAAAAPEAAATPRAEPQAAAAERGPAARASRWRVGERPAPGAWRAVRDPARFGVAPPRAGWTLAMLGDDIVTLDEDGRIRGLAEGV
jgi:hypothetical protein